MLTDVGLEPSVTSVRGSCGERDRGGGRGLSSHTGPSGGLVSISPGTASGAIGGLSPASGSNLVLGSSATNQRRFDEDVNLPLIKVVVLGAPTVGKTSVVRVSECLHILVYFSCHFLKAINNVHIVMRCRLSPFLVTTDANFVDVFLSHRDFCHSYYIQVFYLILRILMKSKTFTF